jgi:hypothetical protein
MNLLARRYLSPRILSYKNMHGFAKKDRKPPKDSFYEQTRKPVVVVMLRVRRKKNQRLRRTLSSLTSRDFTIQRCCEIC